MAEHMIFRKDGREAQRLIIEVDLIPEYIGHEGERLKRLKSTTIKRVRQDVCGGYDGRDEVIFVDARVKTVPELAMEDKDKGNE